MNRLADLEAENRALRAAHHAAVLDLICAVSCLHHECEDTALRRMEMAAHRLYRAAARRALPDSVVVPIRPDLDADDAEAASAVLLSQLRASVALLDAEKGAS
jgi:hypothetical protein